MADDHQSIASSEHESQQSQQPEVTGVDIDDSDIEEEVVI